ncbi:MAG: cell division protein FtsI [Armatimonadetes bacterium CG07_land_8_20_14_0_80_59_28]|nr:MAG: cell division protein FtsI [Armatimonadetes bacterium CG07_land_8_20_14_0_80_59_28]
MKRNILRTAHLFFVLFPAIGVYLAYWQVFASEDLMNHPRNRRVLLNEKRVLRGTIFDRNAEPLARSEFELSGQGGTRRQVRKLMAPAAMSHVTGYLSDRYGRTGIESKLNSHLSGMTRLRSWDDLRDFLMADQRRGHDVFLTIDAHVQEAAYSALEGRRGAVVALVPSTGEILALTSSPGYDVARVDTAWETIQEDPEEPLFNRATSGLYPPGSTFKVVTAGDALEEGIAEPKTSFGCNGHVNIEGYDVRCPDGKAHGRVDLTQALVVSCNVVHAQLAVQIGKSRYTSYARRWGLGEDLFGDLPSKASSIVRSDSNLTTTVLAQTGFGQGEVSVTPLQMAVIAATIANGGLRMQPYIIDRVCSYGGERLQQTTPKGEQQVISPDTAGLLAGMMEAVVSRGSTRGTFSSLSFSVAGKTGTAQNPHGKAHAWFIGFAPVESPQVAVACVIENAGAGSKEAAPVVRDVMAAALAHL